MSDLTAYDFELPEELIAQHPLPRRADSRLMVVHRDSRSWEHAHVRDLGQFLRAGDCLVLNDSRVLPARLVGRRRATGGAWQGLFLRADAQGNWQLVCKARGHLVEGEQIQLLDLQARDDVTLRLLLRMDGGLWAARPESSESALELLERVGRVPLPHYIRRGEMEPGDREAYQTVFAKHPGSVAAPTAGLHFTSQLIDDLQRQGITIAHVTLHVGLGTFRPLSGDALADHRMHAEWCSVTPATAEQLRGVREQGGRIVAVGTTVVRTLESAGRAGRIQPLQEETTLFIRPPYRFQAVDALLTNFHLPRSTLLILVRTFAGEELAARAYQEAIAERYRFFSYGDAMLIL
jgi:S-adenosylmethionine:tRNA ribosyltransferase-isomerase